ncbi:hypothetical protein YSA_08805 [Pseudomonas putida ND6]|uniref:Uncharacterized protein n=1 Tax=Pseudomonas putida ND6 TaxID=231023 RepID=I3V1B3_PSEPU|nr:hypothetical protein YSA_08805 [Pseudomonas putida ND6]
MMGASNLFVIVNLPEMPKAVSNQYTLTLYQSNRYDFLRS